MRKLLEFVKKNWLTILLAIVPPLTIWYYLQRESIELTARVTVDVPVVSVRQEYGREIELRYRGQPVDGLRVVEVELKNTGTRPLERTAFDSPVTFDFGSVKVTAPVILRTRPRSLRPQLRIGGGIVTLDPLLLNPRDTFVFRTFVLGGGTHSSPIRVSARIRGVSDILLRKSSDDEPKSPMVFGLLAAILGVALSLISVTQLIVRAARLTARIPAALVLQLIRRLESDPGTAAKAVQLSKDLDISKHDAKANLLFLRLRIETLLRDLARRADLPRPDQLRSMRRLSEQLARRGIIPREIASAIADISPALNRELHQAESYLSDGEFSSLQRLCLSVIAGLMVALEQYSEKQAP